MAKSSASRDVEGGGVDSRVAAGSGQAGPRRINVAVNPDMLAALQLVIDREHVSLTEAVRKLVTLGDFVYRAVKEEKSSVVLKSAADGTEREIVIV